MWHSLTRAAADFRADMWSVLAAGTTLILWGSTVATDKCFKHVGSQISVGLTAAVSAAVAAQLLCSGMAAVRPRRTRDIRIHLCAIFMSAVALGVWLCLYTAGELACMWKGSSRPMTILLFVAASPAVSAFVAPPAALCVFCVHSMVFSRGAPTGLV